MQKALVTLLVLASLAVADEISYPDMGFSMQRPDGWERDAAREGGSTLVSIFYKVEKGSQLRIEIQTGMASGFDAAAWLQIQREEKKTYFKNVSSPFKEEPEWAVGGRKATGYTIGGKAVAGDGKEYDLRYRVAAIENGEHFFHIEELSYGSAHVVHGKALEDLWKKIRFTEPKAPEIDMSLPPNAEGEKVEDEHGNYSIALPPGWVVESAPPAVAESDFRLRASRYNGKGRIVGNLQIFRFQQMDASLFAQETPYTYLQDRATRVGMFDPIYGHKQLTVQVDESVLLGGAEKSGQFRISGWTKDEVDRMTEAQKLRDRGLDVEVPNPPQTVLKGRMAMLSPHIYICAAHTEYAGHIDDPQFTTELASICDSFEFRSAKAKLPPIVVLGQEIGDTFEDPANQETRKDEARIEVFSKTRPSDKPSAVLDVNMKLPPGFIRITENVGGALKVVVAAQDGNNNSVEIRYIAVHRTELPDRTVFQDPKDLYKEWRSAWESVARGTGRIKEKPDKVSFGGANFKGYEFEGLVDGFPAIRKVFMTDKSGWRMELQIDARGNGLETFKDGIKDFLRGFRFRKGR